MVAQAIYSGCKLAQNTSAEFEGVCAARASLARSPYRELRYMRLDGGQQWLRLRGSVSTYFFKQLAQETVRKVAPSHKIYNELEVMS